MQLPVNQALALFGKLIKKLSKRLLDIQKAAISATIPEASSSKAARASGEGAVKDTDKNEDAPATSWKPVAAALDDELKEAGDEATRLLKEKQRQMIDSLDLTKCVFSIFSFCLSACPPRSSVRSVPRDVSALYRPHDCPDISVRTTVLCKLSASSSKRRFVSS